jgi:hypothetical protein
MHRIRQNCVCQRTDNSIIALMRRSFPGMDALNTILATGAAYEAEFRPILEEFCVMLDLERCFDGLSACEADQAAMHIVMAVCGSDDPADYLRQRADDMVASALAISRSLRIAAAAW